MSDLVIQTLQLLPYLSGAREIAPDTRTLDYLDEEGEALEVWKDPFCLGNEEGGVEVKQGYLGNAVPLTSCIGSLGWVLVLDLDDSMFVSPFFSCSLPCHFSVRGDVDVGDAQTTSTKSETKTSNPLSLVHQKTHPNGTINTILIPPPSLLSNFGSKTQKHWFGSGIRVMGFG